MTDEDAAFVAQTRADSTTGSDDAPVTQENATLWDRFKSSGTGLYSALNSAAFGIPDVLIKAAGGDAYKKLQQLRARYRTASTIGDIGGMLVPSGGGLLKGLGKGAQAAGAILRGGSALGTGGRIARGLTSAGRALDTGADIIRTGKGVTGLAGNFGRGALTAAEQSIPRVLGGTQTAQEGLLGMGIGGLAGGVTSAIGKVGERLSETGVAARKWANKTILKNANITTRVLRNQQKYMGGDPAQYIEDLANISEARSLQREPKLDALIAEVKQTWRDIAKAYDAAGQPVSYEQIARNPAIVQILKRAEAVGGDDAAMIANMIKQVNASDNLFEKRDFLKKIVFADPSKKAYTQEQTEAASAILGQIEDEAERLAGLDVGDAKKAWKMMKPFEDADLRDEINMAAAGIKTGSPTAFNLALAGMGATTGAGVSVGGVIENPEDPNAWAKLLITTGGGTLAGGLNKQIGLAIARAIRFLPEGAADDIARNIQAGKLGKVMAMIASKTEKPSTFLAKLAGSASPTKRAEEDAALAEAEAQKPADTEPAPKTEAEAAIAGTPEASAQEEKKAIYGQAYIDKLNNKMMRYWAQNFSDKMEYTDYVAQVAELTNNFDPEKAASFFYQNKKEHDKFLRDLNITRRLKETNLEEAYKGADIFEGIFDANSAAAKRKAKADLIDTLATLTASEGGLASAAERKEIEADVGLIMKLNKTPEEKRIMLMEKLNQKYGLGYDALKEMGLA